MISFTQPVTTGGPIVQISVGFSRGQELAIRRQGRAVLSRLTIAALIDTGADVSMIERGLLSPFAREGMKLKGFVHVNAPGLGGLAFHPQFFVGLDILHPSGNRNSNLALGVATVVEHPLGAPDFHALIGRDILSRCQFFFDGPANTFTLTY